MALTKVSRGLLSTGIVDNSNATAITLNADESATFAAGIDVTGSVIADDLIKVQNAAGSAAAEVDIVSGGTWRFRSNPTSGTNNYGLDIVKGSAGTDVKLSIDQNGKVGIGRVPRVGLDVAGEVAIAYDANYGLRFYNQPQNNWSSIGNTETSSSANLVFKDSTGEAMSLTGGNLLVGNSVTNPASGFNNQKGFAYAASTGQVQIATNVAGAAMEIGLNHASDGAILIFRKQSTLIGQLGSINGSLFIASPYANDSGLRFSDRTIHPCTTAGAPRDDAINLGYSAGRFDTIYAKAGSINTSDRLEKQDIELLSHAEQRVAVAAKGLLRKYRWKSAVAEKGDDARIHFGIIAQDLQDAFTAEGLDASRYGMWCSDTWTDEDTGEERTRLGVRYSELLAFIIAAI